MIRKRILDGAPAWQRCRPLCCLCVSAPGQLYCTILFCKINTHAHPLPSPVRSGRVPLWPGPCTPDSPLAQRTNPAGTAAAAARRGRGAGGGVTGWTPCCGKWALPAGRSGMSQAQVTPEPSTVHHRPAHGRQCGCWRTLIVHGLAAWVLGTPQVHGLSPDPTLTWMGSDHGLTIHGVVQYCGGAAPAGRSSQETGDHTPVHPPRPHHAGSGAAAERQLAMTPPHVYIYSTPTMP